MTLASPCSSFLAAASLAFFAGCAGAPTVQPLPLSAAERVTQFDARSLQDPGLRRFLAENLGASSPTEWDFETLCWVGFYYHPALALARAQWATARAAEVSAGIRPNPTLTLTPGYNTTRIPGVSPWMPGLNFDFLFPTGKKGKLQQIVAQRETEAARLAVFSAAWQLRAELRRALIDTASAARREGVLRRQVETQRKLTALVEQRFAAGSLAATDAMTSRTALLRAETSAADAAGQVAVSRARVATALGLPLGALREVTLPPGPTAPQLSESALSAARRESLQSRSDVLQALAKYQSAQATLELEIAKRVPDFHLGPGYQWDQGSNKWTLGISFELPLFHRNEAAIAEAVARRAEAAAQFDIVQAQAISAIDSALAAQGVAASQLERLRQLRTETAKQTAAVQRRRELGGADQVEVETAELDLSALDATVAETENSVALAASQLEDALQLPFPHLAALAQTASVPTSTLK